MPWLQDYRLQLPAENILQPEDDLVEHRGHPDNGVVQDQPSRVNTSTINKLIDF